MLVKICTSLQATADEFKLDCTSVPQILKFIELCKGKEYVEYIVNNPFAYVLLDSTEKLSPVPILQGTISLSFTEYDTLIIFPEVFGNVPAAGVALALGVNLATASTLAAFGVYALTLAANIAISIAISALMSAISPTPEFSSDPSATQSKPSSLFNRPPIIREQGGSVPVVYGHPFTGGVLISSGAHTEDVL